MLEHFNLKSEAANYITSHSKSNNYLTYNNKLLSEI